MKNYIIESIDTTLGLYGMSISLTLIPNEVSCNSKLHEACKDNEPIYILTKTEYRQLCQAKALLETFK